VPETILPVRLRSDRKSREIISNDEDKADSGKNEEGCRTSPTNVGQGNCKEVIGNNNGKTVTGTEKFRKRPFVFNGTGTGKAGSQDQARPVH
jgi:hypothetical protein